MNGFQITFYTQQNRRHRGRPLPDWLLELAAELGLRGASVFAASEGLGHHHRIHAAHFFDITDQPMSVVMALTGEECERLFARLRNEDVELFYVKAAIEFGVLGGSAVA